ncbi:hypothetical protein V6N13_074765 [Hibiscus sabdariffa]
MAEKHGKLATMRIVPCISLLVFSCFYLQVYNGTVSATDTLFQGQIMATSELLTSSGNTFELGFFSTGSTDLYLAIRMKNVPTKDIFWVANRDLAFSGSSVILTINGDGNLVIVDGRTTYRVSDGGPSSSQNLSATLLESGNLVLRNGSSDLLWQSFDYPLNTFLPGMKLGYNNKTGKVWSLTSWLDQQDPNKGDYELKMDPSKSNGVLLMRGTEILWSSGAWIGKGFTLMPEMRLNYIFNYTMYSDENETYFSYSLYNSSIITRFIIDVSGYIRESVWLENSQQWAYIWSQPRQFCDTYNSCGPFSICSKDTTSCRCFRGFYPLDRQGGQHGGCMRNMPIKCGNGDNKDGFLRMENVKYPLSLTQQTNPSNLFPSGPQVLISDATTCQDTCLNNCSCSAYAYNTSGHCLRWYGDILGLEQLSAKDPNGGTIFIKLAASGRGANKYLWIITIPIVLLVFLPASIIVFRRTKSLKTKMDVLNMLTFLPSKTGEIDDKSQDILLFDVEMSITTSSREFSGSENSGKQKRKDTTFPLFNFASVSAATNNFSSENKLGEGGFGPVYKAWELWEGDRGVELMDPKLEDQVSYPMLLRYIHVALLCVQETAADRPTMSEVVLMLNNEHTVLNSPKKAAFCNARSATNNSNQSSSKPATFSANSITVSLMEPR